MTKWKLYLDDERFPREQDGEGPWVLARSSTQAMLVVRKLGVPSFMSLDHDLGGDDTSMVFLKWLADNYPDSCPDYQVHSMNNQGIPNIIAYMSSWKKSLDL